MFKVLSDKIIKHIRENFINYIILFVFLLIGVALGAYIYNCYSVEEAGVLKDFFDDSKDLYINNPTNNTGIFQNTFFEALKSDLLIWFLGFTIIGIPIVFLSVIKKGFSLGLICNFLITNYKDGIFIAAMLFFIQCLLRIPAIFVLSNCSVSMSSTLLKIVSGKIKYKVNLKSYILFYGLIFVIIMFITVIYGLLESYFTGNLLKWYFSLAK